MGILKTSTIIGSELSAVERYLRGWSSVQSEIANGPHGAFFRYWIPDWLARTTPPTIEELWTLIDRAWIEDPPRTEEQFASYYSHPVWRLNARIEEIHRASVEHRLLAVKLAQRYAPQKALDRGGGYGLLIKMAHDALPQTQLDLEDVINAETIAAEMGGLKNVRVVTDPQPPYDVIWSIEVFEHLPDPLGEAFSINGLLRRGGALITSYSFFPMIHCHLSRNFHLRHIFHRVLPWLGFRLADVRWSGVPVLVFEKVSECSPCRYHWMKVWTTGLRPALLLANRLYPFVKRPNQDVTKGI